jgi:hypothetical protein
MNSKARIAAKTRIMMKKTYTFFVFTLFTLSLIAQSYVPEKNNLKIKAPTKVPIQVGCPIAQYFSFSYLEHFAF